MHYDSELRMSCHIYRSSQLSFERTGSSVGEWLNLSIDGNPYVIVKLKRTNRKACFQSVRIRTLHISCFICFALYDVQLVQSTTCLSESLSRLKNPTRRNSPLNSSVSPQQRSTWSEPYLQDRSN
jgi:hypothetical protein